MTLTPEVLKEEIFKVILNIKNDGFEFGKYNKELKYEGAGAIDELFGPIMAHYELPDSIEISDDECVFMNEEDIFDRLGCYKKQEGIDKEGKIILYKKCIESFGTRFFEQNRHLLSFASLTDCINMVYKIVLWHEFGHWITHWMSDSKGNKWNDTFWYLKPNPNDLLEGLAQLFTYYAILNDADVKKLKFLFEFMLLGQCAPYHKHIEIMKHSKFSWENSFKALEKVRLSPPYEFQSYLNFLKN